jgi:hypothetical protein
MADKHIEWAIVPHNPKSDPIDPSHARIETVENGKWCAFWPC